MVLLSSSILCFDRLFIYFSVIAGAIGVKLKYNEKQQTIAGKKRILSCHRVAPKGLKHTEGLSANQIIMLSGNVCVRADNVK